MFEVSGTSCGVLEVAFPEGLLPHELPETVAAVVLAGAAHSLLLGCQDHGAPERRAPAGRQGATSGLFKNSADARALQQRRVARAAPWPCAKGRKDWARLEPRRKDGESESDGES